MVGNFSSHLAIHNKKSFALRTCEVGFGGLSNFESLTITFFKTLQI